jgi:hypothetical protein
MRRFEHGIDQCRFPVVDMGYDREIADTGDIRHSNYLSSERRLLNHNTINMFLQITLWGNNHAE